MAPAGALLLVLEREHGPVPGLTDRRDELIDEVAEALREFDPSWEQLSPRVQACVLAELIIEADG